MSEEPSGRQKFLEWENQHLRDKIKELKRSELMYRLVILVVLAVYWLNRWWLS
jgi:hypothetical protein